MVLQYRPARNSRRFSRLFREKPKWNGLCFDGLVFVLVIIQDHPVLDTIWAVREVFMNP